MLRSRRWRLLAETTQVMLGQALAMLGNLALIRVLTQQLTPAAFGTLALGLTGSLLVNQAVTSGSTAAIARFFSPAREADQLSLYWQACKQLFWRDQRRITVLVAGVVLLLVLAGHRDWLAIAIGAGVVAMVSSASLALTSVMTAGRHRLLASGLSALDPWLRLLLLVLLWRHWPAGAAQTLLIYGISTAVLCLIAARLLRGVLKLPLFSPLDFAAGSGNPWLQQMRDYGRPYSRFGVFTWLQQASDRWALQLWAGPVAVAQYAIVYQLGCSPLGMLSNMLNTLLAPILYGRAGDASSHERNQSVHQLLLKLTAIGLLLCPVAFAAAWFLSRWLLSVFAAPAYLETAIWLPWMVGAGALFAVGQQIALRFNSDNRTAELARIKIRAALVGVLLNAVGAYSYGITGVVVAQVSFAVLYLFWMMQLGLRTPLQQ